MSAADPAARIPERTSERTPRRTLVWVHEDCLRPGGPALARHPEAPAVAVLDGRAFEEAGTTLKQLVFVYEALLEIPRVRILRGDTVEVLAAAAREEGCDRIITAESASPGVRRVCRELEDRSFTAEQVPDAPFVDLPPEEERKLDLKRFSRYWRRVKKRALRTDG